METIGESNQISGRQDVSKYLLGNYGVFLGTSRKIRYLSSVCCWKSTDVIKLLELFICEVQCEESKPTAG